MSEQLAQLEKKGGGMSEKVLWTNTNPTSALGQITVTLAESVRNFDFIRVYFRASISDSRTISTLVSVDEFVNTGGSNKFYPSMDYLQDNSKRWDRAFVYNSDTTILFTIPRGVNILEENTSAVIPIKITGVKI